MLGSVIDCGILWATSERLDRPDRGILPDGRDGLCRRHGVPDGTHPRPRDRRRRRTCRSSRAHPYVGGSRHRHVQNRRSPSRPGGRESLAWVEETWRSLAVPWGS